LRCLSFGCGHKVPCSLLGSLKDLTSRPAARETGLETRSPDLSRRRQTLLLPADV
jgi:hypothetical protein